jgi:putative nucleotidyltransferase with HDIG domain
LKKIIIIFTLLKRILNFFHKTLFQDIYIKFKGGQKDMISSILRNILEVWAKHLGTLSSVVIELLRVLNNPLSTVDDLAEIISKDQVLTTKLLKLVNSAYFGQKKEITDVRYAASLVGYNGIRSLILYSSLFEWHSPRKIIGTFSKEDFWVHSIATGFFGEKLAQRLKLENANDYFVAGLVHDIGKAFMYQFMEQHFVHVFNEAKNRNISFNEAERVSLETDHCEIGAWIMEKWRLPSLLLYAVKLHHSEVSKNRVIMPHEVIALANCLAKEKGIGDSGDNNQVSTLFGELKEKYSLNQAWIDITGEYVKKETERCLTLQGRWQVA